MRATSAALFLREGEKGLSCSQPGHCEIRPTTLFSQKLQSKLAKTSTILTHEEIDTLYAGDIPVGFTFC